MEFDNTRQFFPVGSLQFCSPGGGFGMGSALPTLSDEWLTKANPTTYISEAMAPLLVQHGCLDRLVPFAQSANFVHAICQKLGYGRMDFVPLPTADHEDKQYGEDWNLRYLAQWIKAHL